MAPFTKPKTLEDFFYNSKVNLPTTVTAFNFFFTAFITIIPFDLLYNICLSTALKSRIL